VKGHENKSRLDLVPPRALLAVGYALAEGVEGHGERTHLGAGRGDDEAAYLAAALRHVYQHLGGREDDPESGWPHLAHAAADVLIALEAVAKGRGLFDLDAVARQGRDNEAWRDLEWVTPDRVVMSVGDAVAPRGRRRDLKPSTQEAALRVAGARVRELEARVRELEANREEIATCLSRAEDARTRDAQTMRQLRAWLDERIKERDAARAEAYNWCARAKELEDVARAEARALHERLAKAETRLAQLEDRRLDAQANPRPWERIEQLEAEVELLTKALGEAVEGAAAEASKLGHVRRDLGGELDRGRARIQELEQLVAEQAAALALWRDAACRKLRAEGGATYRHSDPPADPLCECGCRREEWVPDGWRCTSCGRVEADAVLDAAVRQGQRDAELAREARQSGVKLRR